MSRVAAIRRATVVPSLVAQNLALLDQAAELLERIDDDAYPFVELRLRNASVGAHLRHCLDFYLCLLDGASTGAIDHARRARNPMVEESRMRAAVVIREIDQRLRGMAMHDVDLSVRTDHDPSLFVDSTLGRELEAAASHTIHHFAVIAVLLRAQGIEVPDHFGVAPSTLRFRDRS